MVFSFFPKIHPYQIIVKPFFIFSPIQKNADLFYKPLVFSCLQFIVKK